MVRIDLSAAIGAIQHGDIVVYPTDTLYALGADIFNETAVKQVFAIKKRPLNVPLPVAVSSVDEIRQIAIVDERIERMAARFLPGQLTLLLKKKSNVPNIVTSNSDKIAVRIPDQNVALDLLSRVGPLTVTSANIHGMETPAIIKDIKMQFTVDAVASYLDAGQLEGLPSTIVDMTGKEPSIVREGSITKEEIVNSI